MKIEMIEIPQGKFNMGTSMTHVKSQIMNNPQTDKRLFLRQTPPSVVETDNYEISKYPITYFQFSKFIEATNYITTAGKYGWGFHFDGKNMKKVTDASWKDPFKNLDLYSRNKTDRYPVVMVSWYDCIEFTKWLSKQTGQKYNLPTEAQWEKAARGPEGNTWPWGNHWYLDKCNCNNQIGTPSQVGKFSPGGDSYYGASDMAGNVLEWTRTTTGTRKPWPAKYKYPYKAADGRNKLTGKNRRIARGGNFQRGQDFCRATFRFADEPENRYSSMGFRVCRYE
jgi:formylglycine-generating enzyme required for sulfatase activity